MEEFLDVEEDCVDILFDHTRRVNEDSVEVLLGHTRSVVDHVIVLSPPMSKHLFVILFLPTRCIVIC